MSAVHFEFLVEEPSAEAFLSALLPRLVAPQATFQVHTHQGKSDLLGKLEPRLRAYSRWLPEGWRIFVLVDRDDDDCHQLKQRLEIASAAAGLPSKSVSVQWIVANRILVEELEAWFFGDWMAVVGAYPRTPRDVPGKAAFRACDEIRGGTWEALERVLRKAGYFSEGLRKVEVANDVGALFNADRCTSPSFRSFHTAILEAMT